MTSFRDLRPTAKPICGFNNRCFYAGVLVKPGTAKALWICEHRHRSCEDAIDCADSTLHCDEGSLTAEQLQEAIERNTA